MTQLKHWQDVANLVLGVWLALSPWAIGYQGDATAMTNAVIVGVALIAVALGAIFVPRAWEEWTQGLLGLWLIASPWLLGFNDQQTVMRNAVLTGMAVVALAAWTLLTDRGQRTWTDKSAAH